MFYDKSRENYKNEKMKLSARENIRLKLFSPRRIGISLCKLNKFLSYSRNPMRLKSSFIKQIENSFRVSVL